MEVDVDGFSADIVSGTDRGVLIENQLENSDHRHLGQILTYLAGVDASAVIWIARDSHEAHRSAIGWLNEHTADEFAFFAVRVRVVRIGESTMTRCLGCWNVPITWERTLTKDRNRVTSS